MKLKTNQSGIARIAAILLVVIVATIGFAGFRVWDSTKRQTETTNATTSNTVAYSYDGWKSYSAYGLTYKYPSDWSLTEANPAKDIGLGIASPDYQYEGGDGDHPGNGASININPFTTGSGTTADLTAENFREKHMPNGDPYKNFDILTINGTKAVQFQNVSYAQVVTVFFLENGSTVSFQLKYAEDDYTVQFATYNHIVNSVIID